MTPLESKQRELKPTAFLLTRTTTSLLCGKVVVYAAKKNIATCLVKMHSELRCVFQTSFSAASQACAGDNSVFCRRWLLDSLVSFCLPHVVRKLRWSLRLLRCLRKETEFGRCRERRTAESANRAMIVQRCHRADSNGAIVVSMGGRGGDNTVSWRNGGRGVNCICAGLERRA